MGINKCPAPVEKRYSSPMRAANHTGTVQNGQKSQTYRQCSMQTWGVPNTPHTPHLRDGQWTQMKQQVQRTPKTHKLDRFSTDAERHDGQGMPPHFGLDLKKKKNRDLPDGVDEVMILKRFSSWPQMLSCEKIKVPKRKIDSGHFWDTKSPRREVVRSSARAGVVYPPFLGHSRSIPQGMIFDVQPLVKSLLCPIRQSQWIF